MFKLQEFTAGGTPYGFHNGWEYDTREDALARAKSEHEANQLPSNIAMIGDNYFVLTEIVTKETRVRFETVAIAD